MRKPKVSVTGKKPNYTSCTLLRSGTYFHPDRDSSLLWCSVTRRRFATPSRPVGSEIHAFLDSLSKIGRYRSFDVFIILLESVSVLFCVFHISFRARSYGKIVRLFNLPTGKKNSRLTPGAVVTHQTWMLFLASSMREMYEKRMDRIKSK